MKKFKLEIIAVLVILLIPASLWGQDKKNNITVSGILARYISVEDQEYNWDRHGGYHGRPSPGAELVYMRSMGSGFELGTGLYYQLGFVSSYINNSEKRFKFNDVSFPVLLKKYFKIKYYDHLYLTTGIYFGKTTNVKSEWPNSFGWQTYPNYKVENYSDDIVFSDVYFDFGYHTSLQKTGVFSIAPFCKYRINPTWLNYHQNKFHFGIKINYSLKF